MPPQSPADAESLDGGGLPCRRSLLPDDVRYARPRVLAGGFPDAPMDVRGTALSRRRSAPAFTANPDGADHRGLVIAHHGVAGGMQTTG